MGNGGDCTAFGMTTVGRRGWQSRPLSQSHFHRALFFLLFPFSQGDVWVCMRVYVKKRTHAKKEKKRTGTIDLQTAGGKQRKPGGFRRVVVGKGSPVQAGIQIKENFCETKFRHRDRHQITYISTWKKYLHSNYTDSVMGVSPPGAQEPRSKRDGPGGKDSSSRAGIGIRSATVSDIEVGECRHKSKRNRLAIWMATPARTESCRTESCESQRLLQSWGESERKELAVWFGDFGKWDSVFNIL